MGEPTYRIVFRDYTVVSSGMPRREAFAKAEAMADRGEEVFVELEGEA